MNHILPKALQGLDPQRGDKHYTEDFLDFLLLTLLMDISSGPVTNERKALKNFTENKRMQAWVLH